MFVGEFGEILPLSVQDVYKRQEEDTYLRIFGKPTTRVNRRMGVVLCYAPLDSDLDALRDKEMCIRDRHAGEQPFP